VGVPLPDVDVCERNADGSFKEPVPTGRYHGLLRNARCEQQKYLTMASVMKQLGVKECTYCHAPDPDHPKKARYAEPTRRKTVANFMLSTFVDGLRRIDGKPMTCRSCHTANKGRGDGAVHFLREPRDVAFTQEWMNEILTAELVERSGKRLRCKTCHEGMAPGQPGWKPNVILELVATDGGSIVRTPGAH
jgi:cytochrome c2